MKSLPHDFCGSSSSLYLKINNFENEKNINKMQVVMFSPGILHPLYLNKKSIIIIRYQNVFGYSFVCLPIKLI